MKLFGILFLDGEKLMASIQEVIDGVANIQNVIQAIDLKLDEVKARIDNLSAGSVVTQQQLDELAATIAAAKESAASVLTEASGLAEPAPE